VLRTATCPTSTRPPSATFTTATPTARGRRRTIQQLGELPEQHQLPILPASLTTLATTYKAPAVAQFSLGVQHELKPSIILDCAVCRQPGLASEYRSPDQHFPADDLERFGEQSRLQSWFGALKLVESWPCQRYRTYQGYGGINQEENTTNSTYNGFQTGLRCRTSGV
jgi:hypothetical protein